MAKFPTYEEMGKKVAEEALDGYIYKGKTLREWIDILAQTQWIPCSERLPSKEERKEWIDKNLGGIGYLYPCLVTRYSSINPDRAKNNPYVAKHYYDGEDFVNNGEEVCSEYIIAWMPLPEPYKASPVNCSTCILDNTDACTRGAGRAVDDDACEDYLASPTGAESEG